MNLPELVDSITMPQFLVRKGNPIIVDADKIGVPSVAAIQVVPTMGSDDQGAITSAIDRLYANLRRANTGAINYTKTDLHKYLYNLDKAIIIDRYLRRAYGLLNKFSALDSRLPYAYFKAMGLDYDSFKDNMSDLRSWLNNNSTRLHTVLAGKCDLFERRAWMFENIFKDGTTKKAQEYMFTIPESLKYWDWGNGKFSNVTIPLYTGGQVGRTYSQVIGFVKNFMDNLTSSNVVNLISAELIKAYGVEQSKDYFTTIPEDYTTQSYYNEEVLNEIQNAKLCGTLTDNTFVSGTGYIVEAPYVNTAGTFSTGNPTYLEYISKNIVNYYHDGIKLPELMVATRLSPRMFNDPNDNYTHFSSFGTEIPEYVRFVVCTESAPLATAVGNGLDAYNLTLITHTPFRSEIMASLNISTYCASLWSFFDWAPLFQVCKFSYYESDGALQTQDSNIPMHFDFDNFAILDTDRQLSNIHNACNQSLLYWKDVIKSQKVITL